MQTLIPAMTPAPGERLQRFVGDRVRFFLQDKDGRSPAAGWRARVRTNLGRAQALRSEILQAHTRGLAPAGASWRDLPMKQEPSGWSIELPLTEAGYFKAKSYLVDPIGWQHWPQGPDVGISVHPDQYRTANIIYCAFTRMFGETRNELQTTDPKLESVFAPLDKEGYTVIPPSGKLRDLIAHLPHIFGTLGCRILHLLPVNPTPTTYARFGRYGSPYATLDLTAIDPSLVEFDQRTTGIDQFRELTYATHLRGGRLLLDIVINHTGWGSVLQENHSEWFLRTPDGAFVSPGAWGVTWEDLVEVKHENVALWDNLAEMFLTWCRRGVDGFRCDAGYKVPVAAWQYIVARVQQEYPETLFLLEGLGGAWEATEALLTEGGMHWAYSELFQNYSGPEVAAYLDHSFAKSERVGLLVHYSETHDNERLAKRGPAWSLLRNRLCALASVRGGFGFTCGVEWLATEKIDVHGNAGLAWNNSENLVAELAALDKLLAEHPCFFDGAKVLRLSAVDSPVYALRRESEEGQDTVFILINNDIKQAQTLSLPKEFFGEVNGLKFELLGQALPPLERSASRELAFRLGPGACYCLSTMAKAKGLSGEGYRRARAQAAWATIVLARLLPSKAIPAFPWRGLAALVDEGPQRFLAAASYLSDRLNQTEDPEAFLAEFQSLDAFTKAMNTERFPRIVCWRMAERKRVTLVPPGHWLLIHDTSPFRATLNFQDGRPTQNVESIQVRDGYVACFEPGETRAEVKLNLERYAQEEQHIQGILRFLAAAPEVPNSVIRTPHLNDLVLLTNARGGMARLGIDVGRVRSKYDCVLGANLHPSIPVDRHVFAKRIRIWINADGFISPLDFTSLAGFEAGPPAIWNFVANAGDGRIVEIQMSAEMLEGRNSTVFHFSRPTAEQAAGKQLPAGVDVRLTARIDLEDRNFHSETKRNAGAEHHFSSHISLLGSVGRRREDAGEDLPAGFAFTPAPDRQLRVFADSGCYRPQPEWSENIPHPVEQSRGQVAGGDAFSPGWFDLPLPKGANVRLVVTAETAGSEEEEVESARSRIRTPKFKSASFLQKEREGGGAGDGFLDQLVEAARAFVVRRNGGKTVIAGYPWFLDWGRDTFICARGLLAAGMVEEVKQIVITFARFEQDGTLPNTIHGEDASNRDTSDAPLWFAMVCEEAAALAGKGFYQTKVGRENITIADTLWNIGTHYITGTPNGIHMDTGSGLIWSPSHFTWMDTNYPACTPREGYPVEIQALWIRLLRQLERLGGRSERKSWDQLAAQALESFEGLFWREERGYYADVLLARSGQPASEALVDDALRSNYLLAVSLGLVAGSRAKRCIEAALRHLVVPGALRSLAPLPVSVPLPIYGNDGHLLNNPAEPYWGHYEGDEDTHRKPAYHNGTAWTWTFPVFCEALARAWDFSPEAVAAARAYLGSVDRLLAEGCIGQIPEIVDGDAPHTQRGCDAQAWGVTEALRVWRLLRSHEDRVPAAKLEKELT